MADHPRLPIHELLNPDFGVRPDVTLRILGGDGEVEGELRAHSVILALGSSVLKELLFSKSGELISWKVVEVMGASLKTTKWMLDFLYSKPAEERGWSGASAQEIFQLASLADQFRITELQEKVMAPFFRLNITLSFPQAKAMLVNLPISEEDILEVASFASDFENEIPTASKALLDNCTSLLASKLRTPDDFAQFAREASKDVCRAPLAMKLLAGISNCVKSPHPEMIAMAESRGELLMKVNKEGDPEAMEPLEVSGKLLHVKKGSFLLSFHWNGSQEEQICLFRANKLIVNQQRLTASNFKSLDTIAKVLKVGDPLGGLVVPNGVPKPYVIDDPGCDTREVIPGWWAQAVWKGKKPSDICAALRPVGNQVVVVQEREIEPEADQGKCCSENKVKEGVDDDGKIVESLTPKEDKAVCSNCKVLKGKCLSGQEVRYIRPQSEQVLLWVDLLHTP